jgi:hypothetical protein
MLESCTWKSHDWDAMDRLHAKGYISDPKSKAKSVVLSPEGLELARNLFEERFARRSGPSHSPNIRTKSPNPSATTNRSD